MLFEGKGDVGAFNNPLDSPFLVTADALRFLGYHKSDFAEFTSKKKSASSDKKSKKVDVAASKKTAQDDSEKTEKQSKKKQTTDEDKDEVKKQTKKQTNKQPPDAMKVMDGGNRERRTDHASCG